MASGALAKAEAKLDALKNRMANARAEYSDTIEEVVGVGTAVVAGALYGGAEEKWGEDAIMGASIPLVVGAPMTLAAVMGYGGGMRKAMLETGKAGLVIESYKGGGRFVRDWLEAADDEESAEGAAADRRG